MTDEEIIKALFADGMSVVKIARKMDMKRDAVRAILTAKPYRPYVTLASTADKLLCVIAAVSNPELPMNQVSLIGEEATGRFYTGVRIARWMAKCGMSATRRAELAIRYQARAHVMWVLYAAGRLEVA